VPQDKKSRASSIHGTSLCHIIVLFDKGCRGLDVHRGEILSGMVACRYSPALAGEVGESSDQDNISVVTGRGISVSHPSLAGRHNRNMDPFRVQSDIRGSS
jgi:hypothetical protein